MPQDATDNQWSPAAAIADAGGGDTLAAVITKVNAILAALREADVISSS